jgi:hypothetical protein
MAALVPLMPATTAVLYSHFQFCDLVWNTAVRTRLRIRGDAHGCILLSAELELAQKLQFLFIFYLVQSLDHLMRSCVLA